jgi:hypothetical protein
LTKKSRDSIGGSFSKQLRSAKQLDMRLWGKAVGRSELVVRQPLSVVLLENIYRCPIVFSAKGIASETAAAMEVPELHGGSLRMLCKENTHASVVFPKHAGVRCRWISVVFSNCSWMIAPRPSQRKSAG